ncbi:MAG: hypothetical protein O3B08_17795, partial [Proteobacteria bacterium]|nr:hypothetical protein [Pseudomonadota bacterium]
ESRAATAGDLDGDRYQAVDQGIGTDWVIAAEGTEDDLMIDLSDGVWQSTEHAAGGQGNDILTGNVSRNLLFGGAGDDIFFGSGKNDALYGGSGDDLFIINAAGLTDDVMNRSSGVAGLDGRLSDIIDANDEGEGTIISNRIKSGIDGGSGNDTLRIVADEDITIDVGRNDFSRFDDAISNIEAIDLRYGDGDVTLRLDLNDVIDLTDDDNELRVFRDSGDTVDISGDAVTSASGAEVEGFVTVTFFDNGGGVLGKVHVQDDQPAI